MSKEGGPDEGARGGSGARDRRAQGQRTGRKAGLRLDSAGSHEKRSAAVRNAGLAGDLQEPHPASTPRHPRIQRERCAAGLVRWVLFTKVRGSAKIGVERPFYHCGPARCFSLRGRKVSVITCAGKSEVARSLCWPRATGQQAP